MNCQCADLPDLFKYGVQPSLLAKTSRIATGEWVHLHKCEICGQLWRIDEWDKYQIQFAVRIPSSADWKEFDAIPLQKKFLVESRGGYSENRCIWLGCQACCVNGVAYCANHLYETGARE